MTYDIANRLCAGHAGATHDHNLGDTNDSWKVGGKLFAIINAHGETMSVKTDSIDTARMLIDAGAAHRAAYLHKSWVAVPLDADEDELRHRIAVSYDIISRNLPRKQRDVLGQTQ